MMSVAGGAAADLLGAAAAVCTTAAFLPQAIKVIRERETAALSLVMYLVFTTGVALWFVYGLLIGSLPVILANAITFVFAAVILATKVRHG